MNADKNNLKGLQSQLISEGLLEYLPLKTVKTYDTIKNVLLHNFYSYNHIKLTTTILLE